MGGIYIWPLQRYRIFLKRSIFQWNKKILIRPTTSLLSNRNTWVFERNRWSWSWALWRRLENDLLGSSPYRLCYAVIAKSASFEEKLKIYFSLNAYCNFQKLTALCWLANRCPSSSVTSLFFARSVLFPITINIRFLSILSEFRCNSKIFLIKKMKQKFNLQSTISAGEKSVLLWYHRLEKPP